MAVDTKTKRAVGLEVSTERTADSEKLVPLVRQARLKAQVAAALGDGVYDSHDNFEFLAGEGIEPGIKVRGDSNPNCGGVREKVVQAYLRDPPGWKKRIGYGQRWMVESAASTS